MEFVPENEMLNAKVICLCNLKPAKMRDVMSHAMVLCGSNKEHTKVELIRAPDDAKVGEHIVFAGFEGEPDERLNPKRNPFTIVQPVSVVPYLHLSYSAPLSSKKQNRIFSFPMIFLHPTRTRRPGLL